VELSWLFILKTAVFLIGILVALSLFSEIQWSVKLRLTATLLVGIILIGLLAWPLVKPADPSGVVSVAAGTVSFGSAIILMGLASLAGFVAYFSSWPYGREFGILAVPAGLAIWAVRCGSVANLLQLNPTAAQRRAIFAALRWEPLFWLAVVGAGFAGVLLARKITAMPKPDQAKEKPASSTNTYLTITIVLIGSVLIAQLLLKIFAQNVTVPDNMLGSVVAQPAVAQIVFAVLLSFGITAFAAKKFLNASYIWPIIASAFVTLFVSNSYLRQDTLQHIIQRWPAVFFPNGAVTILPVQIVAFGALGSIAGYWLAVRYNHWRKYQMHQ